MYSFIRACPEYTIYLCHDAKSRRGFAEGAVRAAEWLTDKKGFFDFKDVWRQL
jgi:4-hydroxy-tetrahydrodipicolinate reductase